MGANGRSAYEIARYHGYTGTEAAWLESLRGQTGATGAAGVTGPWLSSYMEVLANGQMVGTNASFVFDASTMESVGNAITLNQSGTVFTINRTGLYKVEWNVNLAETSPRAVIGILENGDQVSGAATNVAGNFSSGTLIHVNTVPYTLSLHNYNSAIAIEHPASYEYTAASIRIHRFADGPSV